jgi:hypothetical protein
MPKPWPLKEVAMTNPFNAKPSDILMAAAIVLASLNAVGSIALFVVSVHTSLTTDQPVNASAPVKRVASND